MTATGCSISSEQPIGDGGSVRARVESRREVAQRQVELGRQHEHRQRGLERDPAVDEPHADRHGDERDAERRGELEHRAREEREAQRAHRRPPVLVAHLLDPRGLRLAPVEGPEGRQAADDVEEVGREERHRLPALPGAGAGRAADQPEEDRHERQRQQHEPGRDEVEGGDQDQDGNGNDCGEDELGEIATEQSLERLDAGDRGGRDLGALGPVERRRIPLQPRADEVEPELRDDAGRCVGADRLEPPGRRARATHDHEEERQGRRDVREGGAVERPCHDPREQHGLGEHEQGGNDPEHRVGPEGDAGGARTMEETRVEGSHTSESTSATTAPWAVQSPGEARRRRTGGASGGGAWLQQAPERPDTPPRSTLTRRLRIDTLRPEQLDGAPHRATAPDPRPEDVIRPGLVEEDDREEDPDRDRHHGERVVTRRCVVDREAVGEVRRRDHHARVEHREERHDGEHDRRRRRRERGSESPDRASTTAAITATAASDDEDDPGEEAPVVAVDPDPERRNEESRAGHDGKRPEAPRNPSCALAEIPDRAERQEHGAVEGEEEHEGDTGEHRVPAEEIAERAGEVPVRVDRRAVEEARERDSPDQRGADRADRVRPRPGHPPAGALDRSRHSKERTRTIRSTRMSSSAR